eukprot:CAMPEP_0117678456 /NCGR_PEP_ID=MMETSP0804-20121206/17307_1 /TAXON_ID=1074897 /ORGANISM="Tetraselmis astigmatica, Strain CCMP880" /LENGTH=70 /DNA_ID=CAMNT_0005487845 /DNA_START=895 /DNA_END=1107 /DNA_ORIENTATION=-
MSALGILTLLANGRSSVSSLVDRICMSGDSGERASDLGPKALIAREKPRVGTLARLAADGAASDATSYSC